MNATGEVGLELAASLEQHGRFEQAEASYREFIVEQPGHAVARFNFACFLRRRGQFEEALEEHQAALDLRIDRPEEVLSNMAVIHTELHRDAAAKLLLERALTANPNYIPAMFNLALQYEEFGDRKTAISLFGRILELNPAWHDALIRIAHAVTVREQDGPVIRRLRRALRYSNIDALTRESLHFALGKALDDCGLYDAALAQYELGNRASAARFQRYDRESEEQAVARIMVTFGPEQLSSIEPASDRPLVFVTGMFRSGSTLFEQVLAAHPDVKAGGEIDYFMRRPLPVTPQDWQELARGYLEYLDRTFPGAAIVTNKRPDAYPLLGMLRAMFPNARFVNTLRDPRDTCLSIWFQQFDGQLAYSNDLGNIAHHYGQYLRLMQHWRGLFGACIFDADYDQYVRDPKTVTESLLAFLGLGWHEGCLEFQRNPNRVRTASVSQVRQPLYRKSSGRWRNYERQLGGLWRQLGNG